MNENDLAEKEIQLNNAIQTLMEKLRNIYEKLSPEKQFVFGAIATYVYLSILFKPENLPQTFQPILELLDTFSMTRINLWTSTIIALAGSADGVRRIILERLPLYKAYVQVFWLNMKFED